MANAELEDRSHLQERPTLCTERGFPGLGREAQWIHWDEMHSKNASVVGKEWRNQGEQIF